MPELPTGTVTFLFTDLEGSTRLWEEHPDAMQGALARHDEILRDAIAAHDGHIVKTTGDGAHAAFTTARDALSAAIDAQAALGAEAWHSTGPLRVRMGLHTCEAEYRDGDYYGTAVNRAARLMSAAHGGQILLSRATEEVARDSVSDGVGVIDLGEYRLRDLARAERVFQVQAAGLRAEFPPLRSLDTFPGNLPLQLTSFIGREDDVHALAEALEKWRLVTLVGVGGVGKSRLAIQVAAEVLPEFPDGAWFCELAVAGDPVAMVQVVAATLGVQARPGTTLEQSIVEWLRPKRVLVVLDNCEHLLREVAQLASSVLRECPAVHLVATSREALGVAGEQTWPLASLALPESSDLAAALTNDSVRLFDDRAHAARPAFELGPTNAADVVEICRRLDGIPLAIELAAARVSALSPSDIKGLLDERFRLLTGGRRTSVERHQTLRATVDWSYSLLDDTERTVFDRLGVFAGSFDASAAQSVAAADGIEAWDVLDALTLLVAKSMVDAQEGDEGSMRYRLLETLRQYARERLDETGDADRWRRLHAEHYATVAEETGVGLRGPDEFVWMRRLVSDLNDIRAALNWSLDRGDPTDVEYALRIVAALIRNTNADRSAAYADWAERAAQHVESTSPERRANVLGAAAIARALFRGDPDGGRAYARQVLEEPIGVSYAGSIAYAIFATGALNDGNADEMLSWASKAVDECETTTLDDFEIIGRYTTGAAFASLVGDHLTARAWAEAGLAVARRLGNPSGLSNILWAKGLALEREDPAAALHALEESAELVRAGAYDTNFGATLGHLARLRDDDGDVAGALNDLSEAVDHFRRGTSRTEVVVVFAQLSRTFARRGRAEAAAVLAGVVSAGPIASMAAANSPERLARAAAPAREHLGDAAYAEAFARGAAMSYDEAMAYARSELDAALAELEVADG